ncbi:hypothetical protein EXS71_03655 [Candidatus Uhrbacteria bacterium]|nr:hypothetical protein [Candidatus Uhrbacteria bacterium]
MESTQNTKVVVIKNIYLYLVAFVGLMMMVFASADLINTLLRSYVFTHADQDYYQSYPCAVPAIARADGKPIDQPDCSKQQEEMKQQSDKNRIAQRERDLIRDLSFILVGAPLFFFHWRIVRKKGE